MCVARVLQCSICSVHVLSVFMSVCNAGLQGVWHIMFVVPYDPWLGLTVPVGLLSRLSLLQSQSSKSWFSANQ